MSKPWFVYIAASVTGKLYVGISTDPDRRLIDHNSGHGSRFAMQNGQLKLAYVSPMLKNQSEARKREIQLKGWTRTKKLKLISGELE
ncbi:MAG: GIY-YIG nuclease family protein [Patescibacteria group bacterium]